MVKLKVFLMDTNSYAGNFEREMYAYIGSQASDGIGEDEAEIVMLEIPENVSLFELLVDDVVDENGYNSTFTIFPNSRYGNDGIGNQAMLTRENQNRYHWPANNSVAIYFARLPETGLVELMKNRARDFVSRGIFKLKVGIEGFRLLEQIAPYSEIKII